MLGRAAGLLEERDHGLALASGLVGCHINDGNVLQVFQLPRRLCLESVRRGSVGSGDIARNEFLRVSDRSEERRVGKGVDLGGGWVMESKRSEDIVLGVRGCVHE